MEEVELKHEIIEEITAPSAVTPTDITPVPPREIAYYLKGNFEDFPIYKTHNGFWATSAKLDAFLSLVGKGYSVNQALGSLGIGWSSWAYFKELHPNFMEIVEAKEQSSMTPFLDTLNSTGAKDLTTVRWVLGKRDERYKSEKKVEPEDKPLQPSVENTVVAETVNINVDVGELAKTIRQAVGEIFRHSDPVAGDNQVADTGRMEEPSQG